MRNTYSFPNFDPLDPTVDGAGYFNVQKGIPHPVSFPLLGSYIATCTNILLLWFRYRAFQNRKRWVGHYDLQWLIHLCVCLSGSLGGRTSFGGHRLATLELRTTQRASHRGSECNTMCSTTARLVCLTASRREKLRRGAASQSPVPW